MNEPLLKTLLGDPSAGQIAGGLMMLLLFLSLGVLAATAVVLALRRLFPARLEQCVWAMLLAAIAAFYLGFAAWFQVPSTAWSTELAAIAVFVLVAFVGAFSRMALAIGYGLHGVWDVCHSLFGSLILGLPVSDIPLGYGMFCLGFDLTAAIYLLRWAQCPPAKVSTSSIS